MLPGPSSTWSSSQSRSLVWLLPVVISGSSKVQGGRCKVVCGPNLELPQCHKCFIVLIVASHTSVGEGDAKDMIALDPGAGPRQ